MSYGLGVKGGEGSWVWGGGGRGGGTKGHFKKSSYANLLCITIHTRKTKTTITHTIVAYKTIFSIFGLLSIMMMVYLLLVGLESSSQMEVELNLKPL